MADEIKITGLEGVRKALRALPKEVRKREVQKALRPGANLIRNRARALVPEGVSFTRKLRGKTWSHDAGHLRKNIVTRAEKKKYLLDTARLRIGVLSSRRDPNVGAWYWKFVEFGTSKKSRSGFLVPAFEQTKFAADRLIKKALLKGVMRQANRVKSR